jgi:hypothetical protein
MMRKICWLIASLIFVVVAAPAGHATVLPQAAPAIPAGYTLIKREALGHGVERLVMASPQAGSQQLVNLAYIPPGAPVHIEVLVSRGQIAEDDINNRLELTSRTCMEHKPTPVACINGDFYYTEGAAKGQPRGGVVKGGEQLRSFVPYAQQLSATPQGFSVDTPAQAARLVVEEDPVEPPKLLGLEIQKALDQLAGTTPKPPQPVEIRIDSIGVDRGNDLMTLYRPDYAAHTPASSPGVEMVLHYSSRLMLGQKVAVVADEPRASQGGTEIKPQTAVLSAHGRAADNLMAFWRRYLENRERKHMFIETRLDQPVMASVGCHPTLLSHGQRPEWNMRDPLITGKNPRSFAGSNKAGGRWIGTFDGRQPGIANGVTIPQLADFAQGLGIDDAACNQDGGGSTTFTVGGTVVNTPSDVEVLRRGRRMIVSQAKRGDKVLGHRERPVSTVLAIVPNDPTPPPSPTTTTTTALPALPTQLAMGADLPRTSLGNIKVIARNKPNQPVVLVATCLIMFVMALHWPHRALVRRGAKRLRSFA